MNISSILQALAPATKAEGGLEAGAAPEESVFGALLTEAVQKDDASKLNGQALDSEAVAQGPLDAESSRHLSLEESQTLDALEEALESLDGEHLHALLELIHTLESQGPSGIRVQSSGVKAAALTSEAEAFWERLWSVLQSSTAQASSEPELASPEMSASVDGASPHQDKEALVNWFKDVIRRAQQGATSGAEDVKSSSSKQNLEQASPVGTLDVSELKAAPELQAEVSKEALKATLPQAVTQAETADDKTKGQGASSAKGVDASKQIDGMVSTETTPSEDKFKSAVVVVRPHIDRLRAVVLRTLEQTTPKAQPLTEHSGEAQGLKAWLADQIRSVESVVTRWESTAEKTLSFLQFVQQKRQQPLGMSQPSMVTTEGSEDALDSKALASDASKSDGNLEKLTRTEAQTSKPLVKEVVVADALAQQKEGAQLHRGLAVLKSGLPDMPLQEITEVSLDPVRSDVSKDMSDPQSTLQKDDAMPMVKTTSSSAAPSTTQFTRWTIEQIHQVMAQAKDNVRLWVDSKLVAMEVRLEPADLGRMSMKTVLEQGRIGILFQVENAAVKELMQQQSQQLRDVMEAQGLEIAGFHVEVFDRESRESFHRAKNGAGTEFELDTLLAEDGDSEDPVSATQNGLIDSRA
jgi:flagellar hook-length control protein FliK